MRVSVCFPYRPDGGQRDGISYWIQERWNAFFPKYELVRGTCDSDAPFNRSQAINDAFRRCHGDIIIVADLDTIFFPQHVEAAVDRALTRLDWGFAFRGYFNLTQEYSEYVLRQHPTVDIPLQETRFQAWGNENVSGVMVCPRAAFVEIGGYDEGFVGWGYEDIAFAAAAEQRWTKPFRIEPGYVLHLWHPPSHDYYTSEANRERYERIYFGCVRCAGGGKVAMDTQYRPDWSRCPECHGSGTDMHLVPRWL